MHLRTFAAVMTALLITAAAAGAPIEYPKTKKVEQVDDYHGTKVADPYRWLETDVRTSKDVADWVAAENKVTFDYLGTIPEREPIRKQLTTLWNYEKFSTPFKRGGRYFFSKNNGLQNQFVFYTVDKLGDTPRALLDPNGWSKDGTIALGDVAISDDAKYAAYSTLRGRVGLAGHPCDRGRRPESSSPTRSNGSSSPASPGRTTTKVSSTRAFRRSNQGKAYQSLNRDQKVYYHRLGTPQSDDPVVYANAEHPEWNHDADVSEDGRYLIISTTSGTASRNQVHIKDLQDPYAMPVALVDKIENDYSFVGNDGPVLYFRTDLKAPKGRLISIDLRNPAPENWKELIPESESKLQSVRYTGHRLVANYLSDAHSDIRIFDTGRQARSQRRAGRHRQRRRLRRPLGRQRNLLCVRQLRHAAERLSLRHGDRRKEPRLPRQSGDESRRLRGQAGLLHVEGRHESADVHLVQEGPQARRQQSDAALRLRRIRHLHDARLLHLAPRPG